MACLRRNRVYGGCCSNRKAHKLVRTSSARQLQELRALCPNLYILTVKKNDIFRLQRVVSTLKRERSCVNQFSKHSMRFPFIFLKIISNLFSRNANTLLKSKDRSLIWWPFCSKQLQRQLIHQNAWIFKREWLIPSPSAISI